MWGLLLALVAMMDEPNREAVAGIVATMPPGALGRAAEAALMGERWDTLLALVAGMPRASQQELAAYLRRLAPVDGELVQRISRRAAELGVHLASESRTGVSTSSAC
jgi:hypothetical protein